MKIDPLRKSYELLADRADSAFKEVEEKFAKIAVKIIYFPYTKGVSSTLINEVLEKLRKK